MAMLEGNIRALALAFLVLSMTPALAQAPAQPMAPTDAEVRELEQRVESLRKEIGQLEAAKDAPTRERLMQQNWRGMQDYLGSMHKRWGAGSPWVMGRDTMQQPGSMGCPMLGGSGAAWPLPEGVSPERYGQQMDEHVKRMQEQMSRLARTQDPEERQRLLQEHWQTTYRDMETMRGMGWMWEGPMGPGMMGPGMMRGAPMQGAGEVRSLPDAGSPGAKLVSSYCAQCHAAPSPTFHTSQEWADAIGRMRSHLSGATAGIRAPSQQELQTILAYMQTHAR